MKRAALLFVALAGCGGDDATGGMTLPSACEVPISGSAIQFRHVAKVSGGAMLVTSPPADPRRFIVEQQGRIRILDDAGLSPTPFLDVSADIACCGEQGLLGLAFHPDYATNRQFFIYYTTDNANVVVRYEAMAADPTRADPATKKMLLSIVDFASNHNGGMMEFGPDGYLYIGTGDGGGGGDPMDVGQNPDALLGKMLRIDVDKPANGKEYGIPSSNPFAGGGGAPEIYIMGLRNPWRWSFDRITGDLWIGDVGQDQIEELTMIPSGTTGTINLGWNMYEGNACFEGPCDDGGKIAPQVERTHGDGWCSVIAGQVYRGGCYSDLVGKHFFTDYCKHELQTATKNGSSLNVEVPSEVSWLNASGQETGGMPPSPASLHADSRGELYLTTTSGDVFRLEVPTR